MSFTKFLFSRTFIKHLILALILIAVLTTLTFRGLKIYTHHGASHPIPNFSGMRYDEILATAKQYALRFEIIDSIHIEGAQPGAVVDQEPEAGFKVKENRTVFLTVNSLMPEQVTLPKLTDISYRQAQVLIENCGLQLGKISYRPSEYNDLVLSVQQDSVYIEIGEQIPKGSSVDLVIGRTQGNLTTTLPDILGKNIDDANTTLQSVMLNRGVIIYDETILTLEDSVSARIWRQQPNPKVSSAVRMGSSVDIWVTIDSLKIADATNPTF